MVDVNKNIFMAPFKEMRDLLLLSCESGDINDQELLLLCEEFLSKTLNFRASSIRDSTWMI